MIHMDCILQNPTFSPTFSLKNDFVKSYANVEGQRTVLALMNCHDQNLPVTYVSKAPLSCPLKKKKKARCTNASSTILLNFTRLSSPKAELAKEKASYSLPYDSE